MPTAALPLEAARTVDGHAAFVAARPSMIWIGDGERPEFAPALAALRRHAKVTASVEINDFGVDESTDDCAGIVVAQAFAGQFRARCLAALRRRFPLAPIVVIVGSLAEGERRSGEPLAAALRIPWAQAATVLDRELSRLRGGDCPSWGFGETLTDDERASLRPDASHTASANSAGPRLPKGTTLEISAADPATAAWLVELAGTWCVEAPSESSSEPPDSTTKPDAILWAAPSHELIAQCRLQSLSSRFPGTPIVALGNFPRRHIFDTWRRLGVLEHCALPVDCDDLLQKVVSVITRSGAQRIL